MTPERETLLMLKGCISELPEEDQAKVEVLAGHLRVFIQEHQPLSYTAFALVGAELSSDGSLK